MQKRKIIIVVLVVVLLILGIAGMVFARGVRRTIEVVFPNIRIQVGGVNIPIPAGNEPFIFQGRTFVPLRLVADALGEEVHWDGPNFTVQIGKRPEGTFLSALRPFSVDWGRGNISEILYDGDAAMDIAGKRYLNGIRFNLAAGGGPRNVVFNLDGQHTRLTGLVGFDDDSYVGTNERNISFRGDDRPLQVVTIRRGGLPQLVDLNLTGVMLLRISLDNSHAIFPYDVNLVNMLLK